MRAVIIGAVTNIILDPVFIFVFNMGVRGAAIATVTSQIFSSLYVLFKYIISSSLVISSISARIFKLNQPLVSVIFDIILLLTLYQIQFLRKLLHLRQLLFSHIRMILLNLQFY